MIVFNKNVNRCLCILLIIKSCLIILMLNNIIFLFDKLLSIEDYYTFSTANLVMKLSRRRFCVDIR